MAAAIVIASTASASEIVQSQNIIIPQARAFATARSIPEAAIEQVSAKIEINDVLARTNLELVLSNPSDTLIEAQMIVPVPDESVVFGFSYGDTNIEAELLPRDEARAIYNSIVAQIKDPALAEFAGYNLIRTSVFPIPAKGKQTVRLQYGSMLNVDGERIDYVLPRSEILSARVPWDISATINCDDGITVAYSTSHQINVTYEADERALVELDRASAVQPGHFLLSYLRGGSPLAATLMTYPNEEGTGGYYVMAIATPVQHDAPPVEFQREVTIVIDRSGSMQNVKINQAKAAAGQVLGKLAYGEAFNIIDFANDVKSFSESPVIKTPQTEKEGLDYINAMQARGGTALHGALMRSLQQTPIDDMLPIVLFLTDGLANVGVSNESQIRQDARSANKYHRRIFTFGVGFDVNAPLLDTIAEASRAVSTYVKPEEDVSESVNRMFSKLTGPVLAGTQLVNVDIDGKPIDGRISEVFPEIMPDLFESSTVMVAGQYTGNEPLRFELTGRTGNEDKKYEFTFHTGGRSLNPLVPRIWAGRKIASLIEEIRQMIPATAGGITQRSTPVAGRTATPAPVAPDDAPAPADPDETQKKIEALVKEIIRLSTKYGVLTEYTAFLAADDANLQDWAGNMANVRRQTDALQRVRSGAAAVRSAESLREQKAAAAPASKIAGDMAYEKTEVVDGRQVRRLVTNFQQAGNRAFFRQNNQWVDSNLATSEDEIKPDEVIEFGTDAYNRLLDKLVSRNQQAMLALDGDIMLEVDGRNLLIRNQAEEPDKPE